MPYNTRTRVVVAQSDDVLPMARTPTRKTPRSVKKLPADRRDDAELSPSELILSPPRTRSKDKLRGTPYQLRTPSKVKCGELSYAEESDLPESESDADCENNDDERQQSQENTPLPPGIKRLTNVKLDKFLKKAVSSPAKKTQLSVVLRKTRLESLREGQEKKDDDDEEEEEKEDSGMEDDQRRESSVATESGEVEENGKEMEEMVEMGEDEEMVEADEDEEEMVEIGEDKDFKEGGGNEAVESPLAPGGSAVAVSKTTEVLVLDSGKSFGFDREEKEQDPVAELEGPTAVKMVDVGVQVELGTKRGRGEDEQLENHLKTPKLQEITRKERHPVTLSNLPLKIKVVKVRQMLAKAANLFPITVKVSKNIRKGFLKPYAEAEVFFKTEKEASKCVGRMNRTWIHIGGGKPHKIFALRNMMGLVKQSPYSVMVKSLKRNTKKVDLLEYFKLNGMDPLGVVTLTTGHKSRRNFFVWFGSEKEREAALKLDGKLCGKRNPGIVIRPISKKMLLNN